MPVAASSQRHAGEQRQQRRVEAGRATERATSCSSGVKSVMASFGSSARISARIDGASAMRIRRRCGRRSGPMRVVRCAYGM